LRDFRNTSHSGEAENGITSGRVFEHAEAGESNEVRFQAPMDLTAAAAAGGVELKWSETANNNVKVGSFGGLPQGDAGGGAAAGLSAPPREEPPTSSATRR